MNDILVNVKTSSSDLKEHSHELIWELNKLSSNLLLHVMPNLEKQLTVEDNEKRHTTVMLLSKMFASDGPRMMKSYPQLFICLLKRFNDVYVPIRRSLVEFAADFTKNVSLHFDDDFLKNVPSLDFADALGNRLRDGDESVREEAVSAVCTLASANPLGLKKDLIQEVGVRMRDKKVPPVSMKMWQLYLFFIICFQQSAIRKLAMAQLAKLYRSLQSRSMSEEEAKKVDRLYGWIPSKILHLYFQNDIDIKLIHPSNMS